MRCSAKDYILFLLCAIYYAHAGQNSQNHHLSNYEDDDGMHYAKWRLQSDPSANPTQQLMRHLMNRRGPDIVKPKRNSSQPVDVRFKMELYQLIELNERQQYVAVSAWIIERWYDEILYWNPEDFGNITQVKLHHSNIWIPDTTLYNTLVMKDDDQRRLLYAKVTTDWARRRSYVEFLYPAIYKFYCRLYLQFFPFDSQICHLIFGSWTSDNLDIDYHQVQSDVGTSNYMPNEGWSLLGTIAYILIMCALSNLKTAERQEVKYVCCPNNYTLLDFTLYLRRRPLFYLVNLVIPTFIITLIAITGFFTTSSTTGVREEKISLCITTLLSMSILMLMVSDQMPSTSTFIPLISWFYMCAIIIISVGALAASFVISVQKFGRLGERLPKNAVAVTRFFSMLSLTRIPPHLLPKDKLLEFAELYGYDYRELKSIKFGKKKVEERKSTIGQFARYIFTAGTEVTDTYPNIRDLGTNGILTTTTANGADPLLTNGVAGCAAPGGSPVRKNPMPPPLNNQNNNTTTNNNKATRKDSTLSDVDFDDKSTRALARIEYDWLATVIERCTFLIFLIIFLIVSLGINLLGFVHWINSTPPSHASRGPYNN